MSSPSSPEVPGPAFLTTAFTDLAGGDSLYERLVNTYATDDGAKEELAGAHAEQPAATEEEPVETTEVAEDPDAETQTFAPLVTEAVGAVAVEAETDEPASVTTDAGLPRRPAKEPAETPVAFGTPVTSSLSGEALFTPQGTDSAAPVTGNINGSLEE